MTNNIVIIQARTNSTRLPGKALLPISSISIVVLAAKRASNTGKEVIVVTSNEETDDALCLELEKSQVRYFRGNLNNVLSRFTSSVKDLDEDTIVFRLTADNVFPDGSLLDELEQEFIQLGAEYLVCNGVNSGLPYGVSVEVTRVKYIREAEEKAILDDDLEHVTPYIRRKYGENDYKSYKNLNLGSYRATIDTFEDYIVILKVFKYFDNPIQVSWKELSNKLKDVDDYRITKAPVEKLVLGSAQFGLSYGINNKIGRPKFKDVYEIVKKAIYNGVVYIDTAREYGKSELVLGRVLKTDLKSKSKIITKLSVLDECQQDEKKKVVELFVKGSVFESCVKLNTQTLDCLMFHRFEHLYQWHGVVLKTLVSLQEQGYIDKLGISVQSPEELTKALDYCEINFIQMPFNILDDRWDVCIDKIIKTKENRSLIVHTRSALLQGLLVSKNKDIWKQANVDSCDIVNWLESCYIKYNRGSIIDLCLAYVRTQSWIDGVVVGMETLEQLDQNLSIFGNPLMKDNEIKDIILSRPKVSKSTLNPSNWSE
jgi:spore coat polysaccharide biosynthesis protein SpsF (cytidylyltransferase family)/aryl-alcohol dehydrogenase-like predicted oxidoreductase